MSRKNTIIIIIFFFVLNNFYLFADDSTYKANAVFATGNNIIACGNFIERDEREITVARYQSLGPTGALDTTFNSVGYIVSAIGSNQAEANAVVVDGNGKIVVAGKSDNRFLVARYTTVGALDTATFGSPNGYVITAIGDGAEAMAIGLQSDGKIVVAGVAVEDGKPKIALARYTTAGVLDTATFGTSGIVKTEIGTMARVDSLVIDSSNNIFVAGSSTVSGATNFTVARYSSTGVLGDGGFGIPDGYVRTSIGDYSQAKSIFLHGSTGVVAAGSAEVNGAGNIAIARYSPTGALDTTNFANPNGYLTTAVGHNVFGTSAALISAGPKYLVGGYDDENKVILVRYTPTGVIDTTFGITGIAKDRGLGTHTIQSIALTGTNIIGVGVSNNAFHIMSFSSTGIENWDLDSPAGLLTEVQVIIDIVDQKPQGTPGQSLAESQFKKRDLNTNKSHNIASYITIFDNQLTIQPGSYQVLAGTPGYNVGAHMGALYNVTKSKYEIYGTSENTTTASSVANKSETFSIINGFLMVTEPTVFELHHYVQSIASGGNGGIAVNIAGVPETYSWIRFIRIS